jgi:hypothetical protein
MQRLRSQYPHCCEQACGIYVAVIWLPLQKACLFTVNAFFSYCMFCILACPIQNKRWPNRLLRAMPALTAYIGLLCAVTRSHRSTGIRPAVRGLLIGYLRPVIYRFSHFLACYRLRTIHHRLSVLGGRFLPLYRPNIVVMCQILSFLL